jgi:hypothetical protein
MAMPASRSGATYSRALLRDVEQQLLDERGLGGVVLRGAVGPGDDVAAILVGFCAGNGMDVGAGPDDLDAGGAEVAKDLRHVVVADDRDGRGAANLGDDFAVPDVVGVVGVEEGVVAGVQAGTVQLVARLLQDDDIGLLALDDFEAVGEVDPVRHNDDAPAELLQFGRDGVAAQVRCLAEAAEIGKDDGAFVAVAHQRLAEDVDVGDEVVLGELFDAQREVSLQRPQPAVLHRTPTHSSAMRKVQTNSREGESQYRQC